MSSQNLLRLNVIKLSDAELYQRATEEAAKHGATFIGPAPTYKYGLFRLADGREIEVHLYHVRDGQWPRDIDLFLSRQTHSRGRNQARMYDRIQHLAQTGSARLLDAHWAGAHHWYSFEIPDGRVVKIRGSKLITSGWPADIDSYLAWSDARRQSDVAPKTKEELFHEFQATVQANNGVVLAEAWMGARTPHPILLSDGTTRMLKPNQLKYIGWPIVPLDELRKLVAPYPVHILPDTTDATTQLFRIPLNGGVYLEGSFAELKSLWDIAPALIAETLQWAASQGLTMVPTIWRGVQASYEFLTNTGLSVWHPMPAALAFEARRQAEYELAKLRRVGTLNQAVLLSTEFQGKDSSYEWAYGGVRITATTQALINRNRIKARFAALLDRVKELGIEAQLLSTEWHGMRAEYRWLLVDGSEVTARLSQLKLVSAQAMDNRNASLSRARTVESTVFEMGASEHALELLRGWGDGVGIKLLSTNWVAPGANYEWALPDGSVVAASLKKVRNCTRAVLRNRLLADTAPPKEDVVLSTSDCTSLRQRLAVSKSK